MYLSLCACELLPIHLLISAWARRFLLYAMAHNPLLSLLNCSQYSRFDQWELFKLAPGSFWRVPILFWVLPYFPALRDIPASSYTFPAPAISPRSPHSSLMNGFEKPGSGCSGPLVYYGLGFPTAICASDSTVPVRLSIHSQPSPLFWAPDWKTACSSFSLRSHRHLKGVSPCYWT